ncbi:MAG: F0F1 ATP synthase subunit gamma [Fuerstiella sp.]
MQNLESLKRSIRSAEDLAGVVRTMKTMAAVSIRQYETAAESLSLYAHTIDTGLSMVLSHSSRGELDGSSPIPGQTGAVVFGSDQGMCGQFNEQIAQFTLKSLEGSGHDQIAPALCIGHRVADSLATAGIPIQQTFQLPGSATGITALVQDLLPAIDKWRNARRISRIQVFHNKRLSASSWQPHQIQLLPLLLNSHEHKSPLQQADADSRPNRTLPWWTMDTGVLFSRLVRQFLFVSLFRACADSLAGENASRIAAMQAAERNIRDRLHLLLSDYAQRRQTMITEELLDVVTGFEALKQSY